jgi:hypothetical protein
MKVFSAAFVRRRLAQGGMSVLGLWVFRGGLAVFLVFFLIEGEKYSPHAARLPQLVAGATLLFLILDGILTWRKERRTRPESGSFLESPRFYAAAFCIVGFFFLFPWLGYFLSSVFFVFSLSWLLGERRWYVLVICSVIIPMVFWYASEEYLKVVMPKGAWFQSFFE